MKALETRAAALETELLAAVESAPDPDALEQVRIRALGRKSELNGMLRSVSTLPGNERRAAGQYLNAVKGRLAEALRERQSALEDAALETRLAAEQADITLPSRRRPPGLGHPIPHTLGELTAILERLGFQVARGPHIEDDFHNFTALNIPPEHPARQDVDTFYLRSGGGERKVLRTHTSPVQIRSLRSGNPPVRIIVPGRTFRCDRDATHAPVFHQIEGLAIDRHLTMGHLKGTITAFIRAFFARDDVRIRFRPSYFPFTEPSAEVDISYRRTDRGGLEVGDGDDWLEVMGCGMVHPRVLDNCGVDRHQWQGFAWGLGVERFAMLKYGIPDLRSFFESDLAWLKHYGFDLLARPGPPAGPVP